MGAFQTAVWTVFPCHSMSRGRPTFTESNRAIVLISSQEWPKSKPISAGPIILRLIERQIESAKLRPASFIVTKGWNSLSLLPNQGSPEGPGVADVSISCPGAEGHERRGRQPT